MAAGHAPLNGQEHRTLRGVLGDAADGAAVRGALVSLADSIATLSGDAGEFALDSVPLGRHRLSVVAAGYAPVEFAFDITASLPTDVDIGLVPLRRLDPVDLRLNGNVIDSVSHRPVGNAAVIVNGDEVGVTDSEGAFGVDLSLVPGAHVVLIRAIGFRLAGYELTVAESGTMSIAARLSEAPLTIAGIEVTTSPVLSGKLSGFIDRMESQIGQFLTPADVERMRRGTLTTSDLLARVPGIVVRPTRRHNVVSLARCGRPEVFLDGTPVEVEFLDDVIALEDLSAVEVYTDPGRIPPQFNRMQPRRSAINFGACGAIVLWTRTGRDDFE